MMQTTYRDVLSFWFGDASQAGFGRARPEWFAKDADFDALIRDRFRALWENAGRGLLDHWQGDALPLLAFIVLTDQFPRNMFRGTARAFSSDALALAAARVVVARSHDRALLPVQRWFCYLPFEHSEDIGAQRESLRLFDGLAGDADSAGTRDYALRHHDIIARFQRFPHRNAILGRTSSAAEMQFLAQPGSGF
jgi:uncharacterized protein (DUF924 family)